MLESRRFWAVGVFSTIIFFSILYISYDEPIILTEVIKQHRYPQFHEENITWQNIKEVKELQTQSPDVLDGRSITIMGVKEVQTRSPERRSITNTFDRCPSWKLDYSYLPPKANLNITKSLTFITSADNSSVEILHPLSSYKVCDHVFLKIEAKGNNGSKKPYGGDYFRVKLFSKNPYSAVGPDYFFDYGNGTYLGIFTLRWPGDVNVSVKLVHPSEAVRLLNRSSQGYAQAAFTFKGTFNTNKGGIGYSETMRCGVAPFKPPQCNLSSNHTHGPWFCVKPTNENLSCQDWTYSHMDHQSSSRLTNTLTASERVTFNRTKVELKATSVMSSIYVHPFNNTVAFQLPCTHIPVPRTIETRGYFHAGKWKPFSCLIKEFGDDELKLCLRGKTVHLFGDSTGRQMYDYLGKSIVCHDRIKPTEFYRYCVGNDTIIRFKFHGLPVRAGTKMLVKDIRYVAEEIDDIEGGSRVIIILSIWAHFGLPEGSFYTERLRTIKYAIERLWERSPETTVIVRSANTREHSIGGFILISSDWIALQGEKHLRSVFSNDKRFSFLDVWDMTLVQESKDQIHPAKPTLVQIMNYFLTMICG